jgi:hypothetical protein
MSEAVYWDFMIRCEEYKEWYHGRCVKVSPEEAEAMEDFDWDLSVLSQFQYIMACCDYHLLQLYFIQIRGQLWSSVYRSTGYTPNMMMLGRKIGLPAELMLRSPGKTRSHIARNKVDSKFHHWSVNTWNGHPNLEKN